MTVYEAIHLPSIALTVELGRWEREAPVRTRSIRSRSWGLNAALIS